jgi:hypothetical protein
MKMTSPKAVNMIAKIALAVTLFSTLAFAEKNIVTVQVVESTSVTMTHHSAMTTVFNDQKDERQVQSFDLKTVINGEHVVLACRQLSKAFATESACESLATGSYQAELKTKYRYVIISFNEPVSGKEKKQSYQIQGSW